VTNMLPRERAELLLAEHAAGAPIRVIAKTFGHSAGTVRDYVHGRKIPGEPAQRADEFEGFTAYCRRRLADDPHLRSAALLAEVAVLGFRGSRSSFYRALERHRIGPHPCPDCHIARFSGYAPIGPATSARPVPALPFPLSPITGETLASFLGRLSAANHLQTGTLLEVLPAWFRVKIRWHDDRWQPEQLAPWTQDALAHLATVSGATTQALTSALPAFGAAADRPYRAADACRRCTLARRIPGPIPVHLPAHHQICLRHGIWLPAAGLPQLDISQCPDIVEAEKRARHAARQYSPEQMILAETQTQQAIAGPAPQPSRPGDAAQRAWRQRIQTIIEANRRDAIEANPHALFQAADHPEVITEAISSLTHARRNLDPGNLQ
jgi:TniQ